MQNHSQPATAKSLSPSFFKAMEQEIALSEAMLVLLDEEQKALVAVDTPALIAISTKKGQLVARLTSMDNDLQKMTQTLLGHPQEAPIRLRTLIDQLPAPEAGALEASRLRLAALRDQIFSKTIVNRKFTEETRQFLNDAISTITGSMTERPVYGRGKAINRPSSSLPTLISREV